MISQIPKLLMYTLLTSLHIYKEVSLLASTCVCLVYRKLKNKSPLNFFKLRVGLYQDIPLMLVKRNQ